MVREGINHTSLLPTEFCLPELFNERRGKRMGLLLTKEWEKSFQWLEIHISRRMCVTH